MQAVIEIGWNIREKNGVPLKVRITCPNPIPELSRSDIISRSYFPNNFLRNSFRIELAQFSEKMVPTMILVSVPNTGYGYKPQILFTFCFISLATTEDISYYLR